MKVYVLLVDELQDNGSEMPVLYGTFSTRERADFAGFYICDTNKFATSYEVVETILDCE